MMIILLVTSINRRENLDEMAGFWLFLPISFMGNLCR